MSSSLGDESVLVSLSFGGGAGVGAAGKFGWGILMVSGLSAGVRGCAVSLPLVASLPSGVAGLSFSLPKSLPRICSARDMVVAVGKEEVADAVLGFSLLSEFCY